MSTALTFFEVCHLLAILKDFSWENWSGGYKELKFKSIFKSDIKLLSYKKKKSCLKNCSLLVPQPFLVRFENPFKLKTSKMSTALTFFEFCNLLTILSVFSWENWSVGYQELKFKRIFKSGKKTAELWANKVRWQFSATYSRFWWFFVRKLIRGYPGGKH